MKFALAWRVYEAGSDDFSFCVTTNSIHSRLFWNIVATQNDNAIQYNSLQILTMLKSLTSPFFDQNDIWYSINTEITSLTTLPRASILVPFNICNSCLARRHYSKQNQFAALKCIRNLFFQNSGCIYRRRVFRYILDSIMNLKLELCWAKTISLSKVCVHLCTYTPNHYGMQMGFAFVLWAYTYIYPTNLE